MLTRRGFVTRGVLGGAAAAAGVGAGAGDGSTIAAIEARRGGRLGVFAVETESGRVLAHRADERFRLCSTFKGMLAALVLARVDAGRDGLDRPVRFGAGDLLPASPVTSAHVAAGVMTVGALCEAILLVSDNAAANLLLARVGGPAALTAYLRSLGDAVTRVDRYELAAGTWDGAKDTTTPRAIAGSAARVVLGDALSAGSRAWLRDGMGRAVVGRARLRAAFPAGWVAGDRTGTADGACNDYAVAWPGGGRAPVVMAAYYEAPGVEIGAQEAALREVGAAVVAWVGAG